MGHILHIISILVSPAFLLKAGGSPLLWYQGMLRSLIRKPYPPERCHRSPLASLGPHVLPRALAGAAAKRNGNGSVVAEQMFSSTGAFSWSPKIGAFPPNGDAVITDMGAISKVFAHV
jgi:hypothetical protein